MRSHHAPKIVLLPRERIVSIEHPAFFQYSLAFMTITNQRLIFERRSLLHGDDIVYIPLSTITQIWFGRRIHIQYSNMKAVFALRREDSRFSFMDHEATARLFGWLKGRLPDVPVAKGELTKKGNMLYIGMIAVLIALFFIKILATLKLCCVK